MSGKCAEGRSPRAMHLTQKHPHPNPTLPRLYACKPGLSSKI